MGELATPSENHLFLFGASTRAAAFSALRAGLRPVCSDLFGDADLRARCPFLDLPPGGYPRAFLDRIDDPRPGPWMYTGALENRPALVEALARKRPLWGNDRAALSRCRSPRFVAALLQAAHLPHPRVRETASDVPADGTWLVKPRAGAGGVGIRFWDGTGERQTPHSRCYFQEHVAGEARSAVFAGDGSRATLLGATWQVVGADWLHAGSFRYCGSVGPVPLDPVALHALQQLGDTLAGGCGLRGLFGVDLVWRDETPYPVEINPRYTASVEVLEYAQGVSLLEQHRRVFDASAAPAPVLTQTTPPPRCVGKAILFARAALTFPADGPWASELRSPRPVDDLPGCADLPAAGQRIESGHPILTFFVRASSPAGCLHDLRRTAADLDSWLFRA